MILLAPLAELRQHASRYMPGVHGNQHERGNAALLSDFAHEFLVRQHALQDGQHVSDCDRRQQLTLHWSVGAIGVVGSAICGRRIDATAVVVVSLSSSLSSPFA